MNISEDVQREFNRLGEVAAQLVALECQFVKTETFDAFRGRVFQVLEMREQRLKAGKSELKGAALIGPAGAGKSRMVEEIVTEYHALCKESGGREFGSQVISVIVPGRATVKETLKEILRALGYPVKAQRDEDYLAQRVVEHMKAHRIAALHLDEVQDSGRYKTSDSIEVFSKRFRNLMQDKEWPVCLILTATPEGRKLINQDPTLTRRLHPIEMKPLTFHNDGAMLQTALSELLSNAELKGQELLEQDEFLKILIHAAVGRLGVAMEMAIEAIGECLTCGKDNIDMGDFAEAYEIRMDCDEELNPFVAENWTVIDTGTALQRFEEDRKARRKRQKTI